MFKTFSTDEVVWSRPELLLATSGYAETEITRYCRISDAITTRMYHSADEMVQATDEAFSKIAKLCGARVIQHEWGIAKLPPDNLLPKDGRRSYAHPLLPQGFGLALRMPVLTDKKLPTASSVAQIRELLSRASIEPYKWLDAHGEQFIDGKLPQQSTAKYLVDIECSIIRG